MITNLERHITYICPSCGRTATRLISPFIFSGRSDITVPCPNFLCHTPVFSLFRKDKVYDMNVSCPICGDVHEYRMKKSDFWHKDINVLRCPETNIGICFIGDHNKVAEEFSKSQDDYEKLNDEEGFFEDYCSSDGDYELSGRISDIMESLHYMIHSGNLSCRCGSHKVNVTVVNDKICIRCAQCGSMRINEPTDEFMLLLDGLDSYIFNK